MLGSEGQLRGPEGLAQGGTQKQEEGFIHLEYGSDTPGLEATPTEHVTSPMRIRG